MAPSESTVRMVADKLGKQDFLCGISSLRLEPVTISPDRIDNDKPYTKDNFHIVHIGFQVAGTTPPWTTAAFEEIAALRRVEPDMGLIEEARVWYDYQHRGEIVMSYGDVTQTFHRQCDAARELGVHSGHLSAMLNPATEKTTVRGIDPHNPHKTVLWTGTNGQRVPKPCPTVPPLYTKMQALIGNARKSTKKRNEVIRKENTEYAGEPGYPVAPHADVGVDQGYLLDLLHTLKGRCAYTGIPLELDGEWMMSLERLDPDTGYVPDNVTLIVHRLNTAHFQWSRELAEAVWPR